MLRISREEFRKLDLEAHAILSDVPLHDAWAIDLPGGGAGRTISDVRSILAGERLRGMNPAVRALFTLRTWAGQLFRWDADTHRIPRHQDASYVDRLSADLKQRSAVAPGVPDGSFYILYVLEHESLVEIRNATVHGLLASALKETSTGYRLYWGVYVQPVSRLTPLYMALIDPFRRFIVYPSLLGSIRRGWEDRYPRTLNPRAA